MYAVHRSRYLQIQSRDMSTSSDGGEEPSSDVQPPQQQQAANLFLSRQPVVPVLPALPVGQRSSSNGTEDEEDTNTRAAPSSPALDAVSPNNNNSNSSSPSNSVQRPRTSDYNHLVIPPAQLVLLQSVFRGALAGQELRHREKNERFRTTAATEIYTTEKAYVTSLKVLMGLYMHPLMIAMSSKNEILNKTEFNEVFPNVEMIINLNAELLRMIQARVESWHPHQLIGDVFLKLVAFFKMYSDYCKDYEKALSRVKQLQRDNPAFDAFLRNANAMKDVNDGLDLPSFLIKPIQRLPRYILLLDALLKYTPSEHPDYESLSNALDKLQSVTAHVNEAMRTAARMNQLVEIENRFGRSLNLIQPDRRFIREGKLGKITSRMVVRPTYFLFNDILVYGYETISGGLVHKGTVPLATTWIRDLKDSPNVKHAWQIVAVNKTYTVFATSEREKQDWVKDLDQAIGELVAIDPSLVLKRNRKITLTDRGAKLFWSMFTYDASSIDPLTDNEKEQEANRKQADDIAAARSRSSTLLPILKHSANSTDASVVMLDDEWTDISSGTSIKVTPQASRRTLDHTDVTLTDSNESNQAKSGSGNPSPRTLPHLPLSPSQRELQANTPVHDADSTTSSNSSDVTTAVVTAENFSSSSAQGGQTSAGENNTVLHGQNVRVRNLDFGGDERRPLLEVDRDPRSQAPQEDGELCSWCSIS